MLASRSMSAPEVERIGQLWIAHLLTRYGHVELLCGEGDQPDPKSLLMIAQFLDVATDHLGAVRRSALTLPKLWRPIRFAINDEG